jgi:subtilase family serine protease
MFPRRTSGCFLTDLHFQHLLPLEALEPRVLLSAIPSSIVVQPAIQTAAITTAASSAIAGFTPAQIRQAYGINSISLGKNITANGSGETIAVVDAYRDPDLRPDLDTFDARFDLPAYNLTVVNSTGGTWPLPVQDAGWDEEIELDLEWAHAIAPGANLMLVEANSSSLNDLLTAVNYARDVSGVSVVTMSWGASEFFGENNYDGTFTTPAGHSNEVFAAASGDDNASEWPSTSPNVLSVGGSTLYTRDSAGDYSKEGGWASDGGGYSAFEPEPAYQEIAQESGSRTTPDVSFNANPTTGFAIYDSTPYNGQSGWEEVGGTSAAVPAWAGLVAIADQGRVASKESPFNSGGLLTALYSQYDPYNLKSTTYLGSFHDVNYNLSGGYVSGTIGYFQPRDAFNGYDLVTGLGSPRSPGLETALVAASGATATSTTVTAAITADASTAKAAVIFNDAVAPLSSSADTDLFDQLNSLNYL